MSELDSLIAPEIINDPLYDAIMEFASYEDVESILEIGSSSGEGSTKAFLEGMEKCENDWSNLYCLELSQVRFDALLKNVGKNKRVRCFNMPSVSLEEFPTEEQVTKFYRDVYSVLNNYVLATVLGWLKQDTDYIKEHKFGLGSGKGGIEFIKEKHKIKNFDIVLIDGSEFTGYAEFKRINGAGVIILDDVRSYKGHFSYHHLLADQDYKLIRENKTLRNGFAIFERKDWA